jgi:hypothetical protein
MQPGHCVEKRAEILEVGTTAYIEKHLVIHVVRHGNVGNRYRERREIRRDKHRIALRLRPEPDEG